MVGEQHLGRVLDRSPEVAGHAPTKYQRNFGFGPSTPQGEPFCSRSEQGNRTPSGCAARVWWRIPTAWSSSGRSWLTGIVIDPQTTGSWLDLCGRITTAPRLAIGR